jgi:hypothetical protein
MNNQTHINRVRSSVVTLLNAADELRNVNYEYVKADMGNQLTDADMGAIYGSYADDSGEEPVYVPNVTIAELVTAVSSIQAVLSLLDAGHASNLLLIK